MKANVGGVGGGGRRGGLEGWGWWVGGVVEARQREERRIEGKNVEFLTAAIKFQQVLKKISKW